MDRTVSRRSEPSSRTALMGEQPNPWNVLPPQVAKSRHRGAKPSRRCDPVVPHGRALAQRIKGTPGITG